MTTFKRWVKIRKIAHLAGIVSVTDDRVSNDRQHVSATTQQRVMQAKQTLETGAQNITSARPWRLKVFLPDEAGPSTEFRAACFQKSGSNQKFGSKGNATIECVFTKNRTGLVATKTSSLRRARHQSVTFQVLEYPLVYDAVSALAAHGIPALGLISGLGSANIISLIDNENRATGCTAGYLMGRFLEQAGTIAIISAGQLYQVHEEREIGFRSCLRQNFPTVNVVKTYCGQDDSDQTYDQTLRVIAAQSNLLGIYNVGAGNEGLIRAPKRERVNDETIKIGRNLSAKTKQYLLLGSIDIILHQNMRAPPVRPLKR